MLRQIWNKTMGRPAARAMKKRLLTPLFGVMVLLGGCVPDETIRWNADGTAGVYYADEKVGLIDEKSGQNGLIDEGEAMPWPDISADGTMVCYVKVRTVMDFESSKPLLTTGQLAAIETSAAKVVQGLEAGGTLETLVQGVEGSDTFRTWVKKYVYDGWKDKYGFSKNDDVEAELSELILCTTAAPDDKEVLARSISPLGFNQFSPDGTKIGYVECGEELSLNQIYVLSLKDRQMTLVDDRTSIFFDWNDDGTAICYARSESDNPDSDYGVPGTLCQRQVVDANGNLMVQTLEDGSFALTNQRQELAGLLYSGWCNKVTYAPGGRIYFSSAKLTLPASTLDEPEWSLFCCDLVTGTVGRILPEGAVFSVMDGTLFSLSPDGTKILMPSGSKCVLVYEPANKQFTRIVGEPASDQREEWPGFVPSWKGNDAVCCVFEKQNEQGETDAGMGIFNLQGELQSEVTVETAP